MVPSIEVGTTSTSDFVSHRPLLAVSSLIVDGPASTSSHLRHYPEVGIRIVAPGAAAFINEAMTTR
jgi:hypothetical protein